MIFALITLMGLNSGLQSLGKKPIHRQVILSKPINCLRLAEAMFPEPA